MADIIPLLPDKQAARAQLNITNDAKCLAILPGSRRAEIEMLSADFARCSNFVKRLSSIANLSSYR